MAENLLEGETIVGIPDLDAIDPALRGAGTEAWKLRAATRDAHSILTRCDSERERERLAGDVYTALTETLPAFMDAFATLYDVGTLQFQYIATGMHDSIDNPDRVAQHALRRYHHETAKLLERVDALAERYLDTGLDEHASMDGYTDRFRLEDDVSSVAGMWNPGGWMERMEEDMNAYEADGFDEDRDDERRGFSGTYSF